jgi:hypothetical protein
MSTSISIRLFWRAVLVMCLLYVSNKPVQGQTAGNNVVYDSAGNCSANSGCAGSGETWGQTGRYTSFLALGRPRKLSGAAQTFQPFRYR